MVEASAVISAGLDVFPLTPLRSWLLERGMEVRILPPRFGSSDRDEEAVFQLAIEKPRHLTPFIYCDFAMVLTNHRTDRKERIIGARFALKQRRLRFWRKTLIDFPVVKRNVGAEASEINDLPIEPMAAPIEVHCLVNGPIEVAVADRLPRMIEGWVELEMVGPIRRMRRSAHSWRRTGSA